MFDLGTPLWGIAARSVLVYVAMVAGLRLMGKRELGQMTVFDLVVILLIANAVQNAMVGPDFSVQGGIVAAFVLLGANRVLSLARLHGRWGRFLEGTPTVLVQDGKLVSQHLRREGLQADDVEMAVREHGLESLESVGLAVLEPDGAISVVPRSSRVLRSHRRVRQLKKR
jgi:uncharacterized membrane protein YcaP (DUF421 family)